jgi:transcriptional regulator with XRE-family HTH domain
MKNQELAQKVKYLRKRKGFSQEELSEKTELSSRIILNLVFLGAMHLYNLILIVINSIRINKDKNVGYFPRIGFIRK